MSDKKVNSSHFISCILYLSSFILLVLIASPASAQFGPGNLVSGGVAARLRVVQVEIVGGRLVAASPQVGAGASNFVADDGQRRERLSIDLTNAAPGLRYSLVDKAADLAIDVTDGEKFSIRHTRKDGEGTQAIEFTQAPRHELTLAVETPAGKRIARGPTFWHLLLAEPAVCKQLLAPPLEMLKPGWKLAPLADAIEEALCQQARLRQPVDRTRWSQWVANLASPRFADRQSSERELLATGRGVLPFLRGLERTTLDAEQWRRIRNVIAALDNEYGDSVDHTVTLLAGDPRAWVSLLNRDDEAKRWLALEQLRSITGEAIEFDPVAEAGVRQQQYEKLRERFEPARLDNSANEK